MKNKKTLDLLLRLFQEACWKGYKKKGMKKKNKKIVPNCVKEGYFIRSEDFQRRIQNTVAGFKIEMKMYNRFAALITSRDNAAEILKKSKQNKLVAFYSYPVEEPVGILIFDSIDSARELLRKNPDVLKGYVKY